MNSKGLVTAVTLVAALSLQSSTEAVLIAHEGFDYPAGVDIDSQNGGTGFSSSWNGISNTYRAVSPGLSFGNLVTTGNASGLTTQTSITRVSRNVSSSAPSLYVSFLVEPTGTLNAGSFNGFFGLQVNTAGDDNLFFGKPGGGAISEWVIEQSGGSNQVSTGVSAVVGQTTLLVLRIDYVAMGTDMLTMYVDPTPGQPEPAMGTVNSLLDVGDLQSINMFSTGAHVLDEIRIGTAFSSVTPVPEPSAFLFLALVGFVGAGARRWGSHRRRI